MELNVSRMQAALELMKFIAMQQMCEGEYTCSLNENDVNEILVVAGMGVITPESLNKKELEVL